MSFNKNKEEELFARKIVELKNKCETMDICTLTSFLSLEKQAQVLSLCGNKIDIVKNGLFENAERVRMQFKPKACSYELDFGLVLLVSGYNEKFLKLGHRDVLGAILALGIKRDAIGDIVICEQKIAIVVEAKIANFVISELVKIHQLNVQFHQSEEHLIKEDKFGYETHIVSSYRLDVIVASIAKLPRSKAQALLSNGLVSVKDKICYNNDYNIIIGERFSIRGYGKFFICNELSLTKKQNIVMEIARYL